MQWLGTFILGMIAGAVGWQMFVVWFGRRLKRQREAEQEGIVLNIFDTDGNPITPDDPRYQEAMEMARQMIKKNSGGD